MMKTGLVKDKRKTLIILHQTKNHRLAGLQLTSGLPSRSQHMAAHLPEDQCFINLLK
jgi:hypothetical protein